MKNSDNNTKKSVGKEIIKINALNLSDKIYEVRGEKVMLDFDLAEIYGYETRYLNRQVARNIEKFDEDFMFQLTPAELNFCLRCQNGTLNAEGSLRSQIVTLNSAGNRRGEHFKYMPYAFTEQGIYILTSTMAWQL